ncbi:hypothetical protein QA640_18095 [Bradyrhizobium sp. CB82]|uniref:hypothetical protein n=1 Tax=Bradyrhizobium sp. CB82 TaxID=3039159 RepID=UPI0024B232D5|nr:hypothetical protein [Bradyrhizobium sp. CB82]WFU44190.1 hypothetical protein QA640_18095 [Bradyrhizobium sp. CB82]
MQLEEEIFDAYWAAVAHYDYDDGDGEIPRLEKIWRAEGKRFINEGVLTEAERWARIWAMPEFIEHDRLVVQSEQDFERMDKLIQKMWAIPARTEVGRKSKVLVVLACVLRGGWTVADKEADWEIELARRLMIEFVGGEPAEELREQFA